MLVPCHAIYFPSDPRGDQKCLKLGSNERPDLETLFNIVNIITVAILPQTPLCSLESETQTSLLDL